MQQLVWRTYEPSAGHPDWDLVLANARATAEAAARLLPSRSRPSEALRRAKSLATFARTFAVNKRRLARGDEALRPFFYIWTMLNACNLECSYCDNHRGQKYPDLPNKGRLDTEQGRRLLKIMRTTTSSLYFCGGEPTLRPDLPELTDEARHLGYWPMMIHTTATRFHRLLSEPRWARWLSQIDVVIVSLDALNVDVLKRMYVYDTPEDIISNIVALRALSEVAGFKLILNCVIQPGLIEEARAVLRFSQDLGCWFSCVPMNDHAALADGLLQDHGYRSLAGEIIETSRKGRVVGGPRLMKRLLNSEPIRCIPTAFAHVDPDGALLWPCKGAVNVEPAHIPVTNKAHVDQITEEGRRTIEPTGFHGPGPHQCGGQCSWMQHYVVDAYGGLLRDPRGYAWVLPGYVRSLGRR